MSKKVIFSICLIGVGVISSLLILLTYGMSGGNPAITVGLLSIAVGCIIVGSILIFTRLLDRTINPLVEEIHKDIEDDIQDLKERRVTNTHWMVIILTLAVIALSFFFFRLHKIEAAWGPVPVIIPTFVGLLCLAWFIPRTGWFRRSRDHTPMWIFFIPTIGLIISLWLGLAKAEDLSVLSATRAQAVSYNTYHPAGIFLQGVSEVSDIGIPISLPDCGDNDVCGAIYLVIGLIVLTLVLVLGSAYIPHFWILSTSILLGIMLLIALHDLRIRREVRAKPAAAP